VEVKRPELADAVSPDDLNSNEDDAAKQAQAPGKPAAPPEAKPVEDSQMKKALELLRENKPAAAQRST
jgi:hypothetical protein